MLCQIGDDRIDGAASVAATSTEGRHELEFAIADEFATAVLEEANDKRDESFVLIDQDDVDEGLSTTPSRLRPTSTAPSSASVSMQDQILGMGSFSTSLLNLP